MKPFALGLRQKIYFSFALSTFFYIAFAAFTYNSLYSVADYFNSIQRIYQTQNNLLMISNEVQRLKRHVGNYTATGEKTSADAVQLGYERVKKLLSDVSDTPDQQLKISLDMLNKHLDNYYVTFLEVQKQLEKNRNFQNTIWRLVHERDGLIEEYKYYSPPGALRDLADKAHISFLEGEKSLSIYFNTSEYQYAEKALRLSNESEQTITTLLSLEKSPMRKGKIYTIRSNHLQLSKVFNLSIQHTQSYLFLLNVVMASESYELLYNTGEIYDSTVSHINQLNAQIHENLLELIKVIVYVGVLIFAVMMFISIVIVRSIVTPLSQLTDTFQKLSQEEEVPTIKIPDMMDEIGKLTRAAASLQEKNIKTAELSNSLRISEKRMRLASEIGQIGIWEYDIADGAMIWDETMLRLYDLPAEKFDGTYSMWTNALHPDDLIKTESILNTAIAEQKMYNAAFRIILHDGTIRYLQAYGFATYDEQSHPIKVVGINYDITDSKQTEEELQKKIDDAIEEKREQETLLIQQSKLASMGEMISAISHQWRQPLNSVGLYVQDFKSAYKYGELDEHYLNDSIERIMQQIRYMSQTIDDFRNFYRIQSDTSEFDIVTSIQSSLNLYQAQLHNHDIEYTFHFDPMHTYIMEGNSNHLQQCFVNIFSNAVDAIKERRHRDTQPFSAKISVRIENIEDSIHIIINDNGIGISAQNAQKVFEPYFTTKQEGSGTGLGLYMSHTILHKYFNGTIMIQPQSEGVSVIITLPSGQGTIDD